ncbi:bifunctional proline dehydrogenase/L-glutamate gamma-semialdehyde dehydrogenase [Plantibacter sp. Mn2098]|uniref:bifunctional proline dehydrogenase/L-glutamate gamma-semialdehyde dehydrogenase n=1 Tax=Plantibacter sp. Mn2098 TaxID=3395266 RepID=UPI003BBEBE1E
MVNVPDETSPEQTALEHRAIALASRWVDEGATAVADPAAARLAGVLRDPDGLAFTVGFVDGVMRPEDQVVAGNNLAAVAKLTPGFLPWQLKTALRVGGTVAPAMPWGVVPIARSVLRRMVGHLVVDATPAHLEEALTKLRADGSRLNLNLLGEAVLGEREAAKRLAGVRTLLERPDVDYVSVKVSSIASQLSMWSFDEAVERIVGRLTPLYETGLANGTFINLDMEEYRDLDLTIAAFTRILDQPHLLRAEAGIVLQAYLPDALAAMMQLTAWSKQRVAAGGAPIKVRLVKGANLAMERVDAALHGWPLATVGSKREADTNYKRVLHWALTPEHTAVVKVGVAGHNVFDIAYAFLLAGDRGVADHIDFEMLLGMATGQVEAIKGDVGNVLLYTPVVDPKEFDVAIAYLVRRLEENASADNFMSAVFELASSPTLFARERRRFLDAAEELRETYGEIPGPNRTQDRLAEEAAAASASAAASAAAAASNAAAASTGPDDHHHPADVQITSTDDLFRDAAGPEEGLTHQVLGLERGSRSDSVIPSTTGYVETAVFSRSERGGIVDGAISFTNTPDTDPSLPRNREWAAEILARVPGSTLGTERIASAEVTDAAELDRIVAGVAEAGRRWASRPAAARATVLRAAGRMLAARRASLIEVMASETGKTIAEGDPEVSEAIDFANYAAANARGLDEVRGARFVPSRVTLVVPPWNFPVAIPAGGVLSALAAGSGVVIKPAPQAKRSAAVLVEALWDAGVPRDVLALVDVAEDELGEHLVTHPDVDRVVLTGSFETAALFRSWRADLPLLAETSGKNAIIVTPSADLDLAVADIVQSAFGHAGQKCSAASLVILVGSVARSERFLRQLEDAVRSVRVGWPADAGTRMGPIIEPAGEKLLEGLTSLRLGEHWLVQPQLLDDSDVTGDAPSGRLWSPGVRTGVQAGSPFHTTEYFGPVLGVMHAPTLADAIRFQNATPYGLTTGIHTLDADDLAEWVDHVEAGNLYVNRGITGAIVQRQPFGGWKRSSVGTGAKAGGPNALFGLGDWIPDPGSSSRTLHLRGLDTRIAKLIEAAQPSLTYEAFDVLRRSALSDAVEWGTEFGEVKDVSKLGVERNLFRYRPVPVTVRMAAGADLGDALRVLIAAVRSRSAFTLSLGGRLPREVRDWLTELDIAVSLETDEQWLTRMAARAPIDAGDGVEAPVFPTRVRIVGPRREPVFEPAIDEGAEVPTEAAGGVGAAASLRVDPEPLALRLSEALGGDPEIAIYAGPVTQSGRVELLPFLREQSISITAHRFGTPDPWSQAVI